MSRLDLNVLAEKLEVQLGRALRAASEAQTREGQARLRDETAHHTVESWQLLCRAKVVGAGALSGLVGGPVGLALEAVDLAYLFQVSARACFGIGHIYARNVQASPGMLPPVEVDPEHDLALIVAIWSGAVEAGNVAPQRAGMPAVTQAGRRLSSKAAARVLARLILKGGSKTSQKILGKVVGKLLAKLATKLGTRWIPIVGGITSAAVNVWVLDGLVEAARRFYATDTLVLHDEELAGTVAGEAGEAGAGEGGVA